MILGFKLLIIVAALTVLRTSERLQTMSRELDEAVLSNLRRIMSAAEESGFPPEMIPLLILLTTLTFMMAMAVTGRGGQ
jgi:hypothetical protein